MTNYHTAQFEQGSIIRKKQFDENTEDAKLREQTDNFEALLLKIMLQDAIKNDDTLYPKQAGSDIYHSMYIDQLSQELSGNFGYSELLFNFLKEQQSTTKINVSKNLAQRGQQSFYGKSK
ncbi:rod-binding protein [Helicobacter sp. MIT 21-1697]|uniref:rod-binding protein n=1 Tax=Helicobacter sp. MIT 21-1697 TaxID=2993733 RepID=UPI00224B83B6|nr:rod-binding protein [Helicobacter sp. MIT 21-1697]MCX2717562.1 rod-binding protein [Helicobacter sp. MIT 21-1697]